MSRPAITNDGTDDLAGGYCGFIIPSTAATTAARSLADLKIKMRLAVEDLAEDPRHIPGEALVASCLRDLKAMQFGSG